MPSTSLEQYELELVNETRLNPLASAARYIGSYAPLTSPQANIQAALTYFNVSGPALQAAYAALTAAPPLAFNDALASAARDHNAAMIAADTQSHQLGGEAAPGDRLTSHGYAWNSWAENVYAYTDNPLYGHAGFMVDWGSGPNGMQSPAGHRNNIMSTSVREVGIGITAEGNSATSVGPLVMTEDFGRRNDASVYVLGVAYSDSDRDAFYSIGEGLSGLSVALGGAGTTSSSSGGYTLAAAVTGLRTISLTGAGLAGTVSVSTVLSASQNLKIDVVDGTTLALSVSATVSGPVSKIVGLGIAGLALTGDGGSQTIVGTIGNDTLSGAGGNDMLAGGDGNDLLAPGTGSDVIYGGRGDDTASFAFASGAATIGHSAHFTTVSGPGLLASLRDVEHLAFTDGTVNVTASYAQLPSDLNGDATSDIVLQNGGSVVSWSMRGGLYQSGTLITGGAAGFTVKGTGDLNADGTSDVVLQSGGTVVEWLMKDGRYLSGSVITTGAAGYAVKGTGDFNGDGTSDILLQNGGTVVEWLMKDGRYQSGNTITSGAAGFDVVGIGDFNGDGTSDIMLQSGGTVVEWLMKNGIFESGKVLTTGAVGFKVAAVGDFNGDGTTDVALQNGGTVVTWTLRNGDFQAGHVVTTGAEGFTVRNAGDYDADGTDDLVLQGGGTVVDWIMHDGQYADGHVLTSGLAGYLVT